MNTCSRPFLISLVAASLLPACCGVPLIDPVSKRAAASLPPEPPPNPHVPQLIVDHKDPQTRPGGELHVMYNNTYVGTAYSPGSGNAGQIQTVFATGSLTPTVNWYRNGVLVGPVSSTAINLQLVQHQVRFYDTADGTWFPSSAIPINLTSSNKKAVVTIKIQ